MEAAAMSSDTGKPPPEHPPYQPTDSPAPGPYKRASGNWPAFKGDVKRASDFGNLKLLCAIIAGTVAVLAWGQGKLDAGVAPVKELVAAEKAERKEADAALREEMREGFRAVREDLRAAQRGVPLPPLPPPDGGAP